MRTNPARSNPVFCICTLTLAEVETKKQKGQKAIDSELIRTRAYSS